MKKIPAKTIENIARVCHEANRAYCLSIGEAAQPAWEYAPEWQRLAAVVGVENVAVGILDPEESHNAWTQQKIADGWKYGPVKDGLKKEHPCLVPYNDLPPEQQMKDALFVSVAKTLLGAP